MLYLCVIQMHIRENMDMPANPLCSRGEGPRGRPLGQTRHSRSSESQTVSPPSNRCWTTRARRAPPILFPGVMYRAWRGQGRTVACSGAGHCPSLRRVHGRALPRKVPPWIIDGNVCRVFARLRLPGVAQLPCCCALVAHGHLDRTPSVDLELN